MILDLTKAELPDWWPEWMPKILKVEEGQWDKEYQLNYTGCPPKLKLRIQDFWFNKNKELGISADRERPLGFTKLPKGAVLR